MTMGKTAFFLKKDTGTVIGLLILVTVLASWSISSRAEIMTNNFYDVIRVTESREEVVIVGIDDKSLQLVGAWPWDRAVFGELSRILSAEGAKAVVYDMLFLEPREGDEEFRKEILGATSSTVLASKVEGSSYAASHLLSTSSAVLSALANVAPDTDGKVRRYPDPYLVQGACIRGLGERAFLSYVMREKTDCEGVRGMFRYSESVATYSLSDVIQGSTTPQAFKGKVVFVGATALGLEDYFLGINGNKIPGVYVHASIFTSLLNSVHDRNLPPYLVAISIILLTFLTTYLMYRIRSVTYQLAAMFSLIVFISILSVVLFSFGVQLPFLPYVASVLASSGYVAGIGFMRERIKNAHIQSIFSRYVHKDVLNELLSSDEDIKLGGERRQISILFTDIRGFTSISENLSPENLTSLLNRYLSAMMPEILEEKGTIDKFIGDAIMAFWNAPLTLENHPLHAVKAALRMHATLERFNQENGTSLHIGAGIHTGNAVVGNVGGKDHVNYTALGDTVNLASRLEGLTKKYGVSTIVTKSVVDAIRDEDVAFRCLDVITVLGKTNPTTLYEARWRKDFKKDLIEDYERAFKYYFQKEWNKAEHILRRLVREGDRPSEVLLSRIPEARKKEDWDGIWKWEEK